MIIKNNQANEKTNSKSCVVREYPFKSKLLGIATALINGRYPDKGKAINYECEETYYVISGKAKLYHQDGEHILEKGDAFFFEKGKWYWLEANDLEVVVSTSPAWFPEQNENIN